ncbi:MAG TPA: hypothetical protein VGF37_04960, partial [Chthoniobacterales bacterium]
VFAQNCIACHSSKQPDFFEEVKDTDLLDLLHKPDHPFNARYREWALAAVEKPEFWQENYLSTDRRVPVSLIGTNAGRALATNGIADQPIERAVSLAHCVRLASSRITSAAFSLII